MSIESGALTADQRTELLNYEVGRFALEGWTVSSVAGSQAVLQRKKRIGFWGNLFLTFFTWGLWMIVVLLRILNRRIESLILTNGNAMEIAAQAESEGVNSLRRSGLMKVKQGLTSVEEVLGCTNE